MSFYTTLKKVMANLHGPLSSAWRVFLAVPWGSIVFWETVLVIAGYLFWLWLLVKILSPR